MRTIEIPRPPVKVQVPETAQDAYNAIRAYFTNEAEQLGVSPNGGCVYKDPLNPTIRCAVGCLIPDALHPENLGGFVTDVVSDSKTPLEVVKIVNGETPEGREKLEFLRTAQALHDGYSSLAAYAKETADEAGFHRCLCQTFVNHLDLLAKRFDLDPEEACDYTRSTSPAA